MSPSDKSLTPESKIVVHFDGEIITSTFPKEDKQSIFWKDIIRVEVHTNDIGP